MQNYNFRSFIINECDLMYNLYMCDECIQSGPCAVVSGQAVSCESETGDDSDVYHKPSFRLTATVWTSHRD